MEESILPTLTSADKENNPQSVETVRHCAVKEDSTKQLKTPLSSRHMKDANAAPRMPLSHNVRAINIELPRTPLSSVKASKTATRTPTLKVSKTKPRTPLSSVKDNIKVLRTPTSNVNTNESLSLPKAQYSHVTPVCTPEYFKTRKQSSLKRTPLYLQHEPMDLPLTELSRETDVPLNALVYQKVLAIVENLKQEHNKALTEKIKCIEELKADLQQCREHENLEKDALTEGDTIETFVSSFVEDVVQQAIDEHNSSFSKDDSPSEESSHQDVFVPALEWIFKEGRMSLTPKGIARSSSQENKDAESTTKTCNCAAFTTLPRRVLSSNAETMVTPLKLCDASVMTAQVRHQTIPTSPIVTFGTKAASDAQLQQVQKERDQYEDYFNQSQSHVKELEAQLECLTEMRNLYPVVTKSQLEVQTSMVAAFEQLNRVLQENESKQNKVEMEYTAQLEQLQDGLTETNTELGSREHQLNNVLHLLEKTERESRSKEDKLLQITKNVKQTDQQIFELEELVKEKENELVHKEIELSDLIERFTDSQKVIEELQSDLQQQKERQMIETVNLQRTLDNREEEIDEAVLGRDRMARLVGHQKTIIEALKKDLFKNQEVRSQMEEIEQQLQETQEFMEQERETLREELDLKQVALADCEKRLKTSGDSEVALEKECTKLRSQCSELEEEVDEVKAQAHFMLYNQNNEVRESVLALQRLLSNLTQLQQTIEQSATQQKNLSRDVETSSSQRNQTKEKDHSKNNSIVCSILGVVHENVSEPESQDEKTNSQWVVEENVKPLIGTSGSAFMKVSTGADVKSDGHEKDKVESCVDPLYEQIAAVDIVVKAVEEIFSRLHKDLGANIEKLQHQIARSQDELHLEKDASCHIQGSLRDQLLVLEKEIIKSSSREKRLHQDIMKIRQTFADKEQELEEAQDLIVERTSKMQALVEQVHESKKSEGGDAMLNKFSRRMEVYKSNWNKAEAEVKRLDDFVEKLRQALRHHMDEVQSCRKLQPVLEELGLT